MCVVVWMSFLRDFGGLHETKKYNIFRNFTNNYYNIINFFINVYIPKSNFYFWFLVYSINVDLFSIKNIEKGR